MQWQKFWDKKVGEIAKSCHIILDVGGGKRFQKGMKRYEPLFKNSDYKTLDNVPDYSPDILGDIKNIPMGDNSVDAVICLSVLEHIDEPLKAVSEIYRILKPGGKCLVALPFLYSYHANKGYYKDFYRFTEDGVRYLFKNFSSLEICKIRGGIETIIYLLPIKFLRKVGSPIARLLDKIFTSRNQTSGYNVYLIK